MCCCIWLEWYKNYVIAEEDSSPSPVPDDILFSSTLPWLELAWSDVISQIGTDLTDKVFFFSFFVI